MVNEISLVIIATVQLVLLILLCFALFKAKKEGRAFYVDAKKTMMETKKLLLRVNEWVESDLHKVSTQAGEFIKKTSDFVSQGEEKTVVLNM